MNVERISLAFLLSAAAAASHAVPFANGGFEDINGAPLQGWGGYTYGTGYSTMADWGVSYGNVDIIDTTQPLGGNWGAAHSGTNFLDLNGWQAGEIAQTFDTSVGTAYTVDFYYRRNIASAPANVMAVGVASEPPGSPLGSLLFSTNDTSGTWTLGTFGFIATLASTTLSFSSLVNPTNGGVFLDSITVSAVPEPAALALALAGIGVVGLTRQRSREHSAQRHLQAA